MAVNDGLMKVIAGLECCIEDEIGNCRICPYKDGFGVGVKCMDDVMRDALEILREVENDGLY